MATKVVDKNGKPIPVYHGTTAAFSDFQSGKVDPNALFGPGFYFTEDPEIASSYATAAETKTKKFLAEEDLNDFVASNPDLILKSRKIDQNPGIGGMLKAYPEIVAEFIDSTKHKPNVIPVYLNIENPFDMDKAWLSPEQLKSIGWDKYHGAYSGKIERMIDNNPAIAAGLPAALKQLGYDGITHVGGGRTGGKAHRVWIAFDPSQIAPRYAQAWISKNCKFAIGFEYDPTATDRFEARLADLKAAVGNNQIVMLKSPNGTTYIVHPTSYEEYRDKGWLQVSLLDKGGIPMGHSFEPTMEDALRTLATTEGIKVVETRPGPRTAAQWLGLNCKFAQNNPPQQLWFDFDPPGSYTQNPMELEDPSFKTDVQDFISSKPEEQAEYLDGFFHVTTNLPAVLEWGRLKSRQQLGSETPGLGGGYQNEAPDMVSLTYNATKAAEIYDALSYAASICKGQVAASQIFNNMQEQYGGMEVYQSSEVWFILRDWGVSRNVLNDEFLEGLEADLDKKIKTPKAKYDFMQQLDDAFGREESEQENSGEYSRPSRVGFTVPYETFCQLDPANIAILRVQVRKGATPQHVNQEMELRFDPDDIRLPMNPVVRQGGQ